MRGYGLALAFILAASAASADPSPVPSPNPSGAPAPYSIDELDPSAKESYFTSRLANVLHAWPPPTATLHDERPVYLRAIVTPGEPNTIGMIKHLVVHAPLERVIELCERFEDYPKIWEDVVGVKVLSRDRNRLVTEWERKRPAFFLPKIRYKILYVIDHSRPDRAVYRQQLIEGNSVRSTDALIVYEKLGKNETRISVLNFFEPDLGAFRGIVEGKIRRKSMESAFKDDIAFRARLEHPRWTPSRITEEAERELDRHPIREIQTTELLGPLLSP
jgi:uncharacterized membrane protein